MVRLLDKVFKPPFLRFAMFGLLGAGGALVAWRTISGLSQVPERALPFSLPDVHGRMHSLEEWRGQFVILNFWAPWCEPCRREIPLFNALHAHWSRHGVVVAGLGADTEEHVRQAVEDFHIAYPVLLGEGAVFDVARAYGNQEGLLPYTVLVDKQGRIVWRHLGEVTAPMLDEELARHHGS
jgi:thiol-disulfide isomerase/thioredoxin